MYTGYFAKLNKYLEYSLYPVSIAGKCPDWYHGAEYKTLAPKWSFYSEWKNGSHKGDNDYYTKHFKEEVLDKLDPEQVIKELEGFTGTTADKIILLCYEKPDDFCHRHLVADWLNEHYWSESNKKERRLRIDQMKDHLISLGYKIENTNDMSYAMAMEISKGNKRELRYTVEEFQIVKPVVIYDTKNM